MLEVRYGNWEEINSSGWHLGWGGRPLVMWWCTGWWKRRTCCLGGLGVDGIVGRQRIINGKWDWAVGDGYAVKKFLTRKPRIKMRTLEYFYIGYFQVVDGNDGGHHPIVNIFRHSKNVQTLSGHSFCWHIRGLKSIQFYNFTTTQNLKMLYTSIWCITWWPITDSTGQSLHKKDTNDSVLCLWLKLNFVWVSPAGYVLPTKYLI